MATVPAPVAGAGAVGVPAEGRTAPVIPQPEGQPNAGVRERVLLERLDRDPGPVRGLEHLAGLGRLLPGEPSLPAGLLPQPPGEDGVDGGHQHGDGGSDRDDRVAGRWVHRAGSLARRAPAADLSRTPVAGLTNTAGPPYPARMTEEP